MLTRSGAKLLDFGLAKIAGPAVSSEGDTLGLTAGPPITAQGTILDTFQYMSPEQLEGKEADARSDIFSFGAMLYEMITGRKGFEGSSHASLIASVVSVTPPASLDDTADGLTRARPCRAKMPCQIPRRPLADRRRSAQRARMDNGDGLTGRRPRTSCGPASQSRTPVPENFRPQNFRKHSSQQRKLYLFEIWRAQSSQQMFRSKGCA
jgi:serine/threonine protein kinase